MKKPVFKFKILAVIICLTALVFASFSGCALLPKYRDPKSVTIDDEIYVGKFYGDMYARLEYKEDKTRLFETKYHYWWRLEDSTFDLYYCRNKESLLWDPALYCKKSQFEEIKSYYANPDNFDYYIGLEDIHLNRQTQKLTGELNGELLEQILVYNKKVAYPLLTKEKKDKLYLSGVDYVKPLVYRVSKDGLFSFGSGPWIYYKERVYYFDYMDGRTNEYKVYVPSDELSDYIIKLLKDNDFELN
ncbi:MAG: hypothetical protein K2O62_04970 [Clostridia bacterium]|nr:hypothetical protein [Clostridia bacterium]